MHKIPEDVQRKYVQRLAIAKRVWSERRVSKEKAKEYFESGDTYCNKGDYDRATLERTFMPPMDYIGDMYVLIKSTGKQEGSGVGLAPFDNCSFRIIWGPWETETIEPTNVIGKVHQWMVGTVAISFKKKEKDQVPLTVEVNGCISDSVELLTGEPDKNIRNFNPDWRKRPGYEGVP